MPLTKRQLTDLLRPSSKRGDGLAKLSIQELLGLAKERSLVTEDELLPKKSRTDVSARKNQNKGTTISCVKLSLNQLLTNSGRCLPIAEAVNALQKLRTEAYIFANLHVLRLLERGVPLPPLDQTFFYRCLCAVADDACKDAEMEISRAAYCACRPAGYARASRQALRGVLQNCSQQMATATKNHVTMNLYKRMQRHCWLRFDMDGAEAYSVLKDIFTIEAPSSPLPSLEGWIHVHGELKLPSGNPIVAHFREMMPCPTERAMQSSPHLFMRALWEMERFNQRHPNRKGIRGFSLLPLAGGFNAGYIKICSTGLRALLVAAGATVPAESIFLQPDIRAAFWRQCFRVRKVETANRIFADELLTDGKAVSVVLRRQLDRAPEPAAGLNAADYDTVWGLDPGMRDMFVATNGSLEVARCSSGEFHHDAKYKRSCQRLRVWKAAEPSVKEAEQHMPQKKRASLAAMTTYATHLLLHLDTLLRFYGAKRVQNLKFARYCAAKKKLHQLCLKLTAQSGKRTLVGFGDWSLQTASGVVRGCRPGPSGRLRRELRKYCTVVDVDEYRTSKTCNCCKLRNFKHMVLRRHDAAGVLTSKKVHSVLHCRTNGCLSMTVNRDVNASRNILELILTILRGVDRPECFCRG